MTRETIALSADVDGRRHEGFYAVQSRMLTVWSPSLGSRTCWLESPVDPRETLQVARALLVEIVCASHSLRGAWHGVEAWRDVAAACA